MDKKDIVFEWRVWGIRDFGVMKMILAVSIVFLSMYISYVILGNSGLLIALIIFFLSLNKYIFPVTYRFKNTGIEIISFHRSFQPYDKYKRYTMSTEGVFLATMITPSRLDNFRGLYIPFSKNITNKEKERLEEWLKEHIG